MKKLLLILLCLPLLTLVQSSPNLLRSTISNSESSTQTQDNYVVQQSVGQNSLVGLHETSKHIVRQGFIQPEQQNQFTINCNIYTITGATIQGEFCPVISDPFGLSGAAYIELAGNKKVTLNVSAVRAF